MSKDHFFFFLKPPRVSEVLCELLQEHPATVIAVTDGGAALKLETVPTEELGEFLRLRSVRRLYLLPGRAPAHEQDWSAIDGDPLTIELGQPHEAEKTIGSSSATASPTPQSMDQLLALKKIIERNSKQGIRLRDSKGLIKTRRAYWSPDLEGWTPKGYEFRFGIDPDVK